ALRRKFRYPLWPQARQTTLLLQRLRRSAMSSSGAIMENSHYDAEIWSEAVADTLDGFVSIEETAQRLGMSHDAAFHMRHKIPLSVEAREKASPTRLGGIAELDD
ncbi:MAG: hypothetical protein IJK52_06535, partial [Oscillospiraceae bacterium]|nr:hypothetical protein [Oscillospiraceae bacterium]